MTTIPLEGLIPQVPVSCSQCILDNFGEMADGVLPGHRFDLERNPTSVFLIPSDLQSHEILSNGLIGVGGVVRHEAFLLVQQPILLRSHCKVISD